MYRSVPPEQFVLTCTCILYGAPFLPLFFLAPADLFPPLDTMAPHDVTCDIGPPDNGPTVRTDDDER